MSADILAFLLGCILFGSWGYLNHKRPRFGGWRRSRRISTR